LAPSKWNQPGDAGVVLSGPFAFPPAFAGSLLAPDASDPSLNVLIGSVDETPLCTEGANTQLAVAPQSLLLQLSTREPGRYDFVDDGGTDPNGIYGMLLVPALGSTVRVYGTPAASGSITLTGAGDWGAAGTFEATFPRLDEAGIEGGTVSGSFTAAFCGRGTVQLNLDDCNAH
jgi:hypothetical protein